MSIKDKNPFFLNYSRAQLIEEGKLSTTDIEKIHQYRGSHNRIGFAYQLLHVRLLNYFPQQKPFEIVNELLGFAALQIGIDQSCIQEYAKHRQHIARHQEHILSYLKKSVFDKQTSEKLNQYLFEEAQRIEQSTILLNKAKQFLKQLNILQPAETRLQRFMIAAREKAKKHIFKKMMSLLTEQHRQQLDGLLMVEDTKFSKLQQLKHPPNTPSSQGILKLIDKLKIIQETCILEVDIKWINNNYQRSLAKYVFRCSAHRLRELELTHRYTALVCFLWQTHLDTIDFMIDMHAKLITRVYAQAENRFIRLMSTLGYVGGKVSA
jgi:hypothetical protein